MAGQPTPICGRCQSTDRVNRSLSCPLCLACRTSFASLVVNVAADYPTAHSDGYGAPGATTDDGGA